MKLNNGVGFAIVMLLGLVFFAATGSVFAIAALPVQIVGIVLVILKKYKIGATFQVVAAGISVVTAVGTLFFIPFPVIGFIGARNAYRYPKLLELHIELGSESVLDS